MIFQRYINVRVLIVGLVLIKCLAGLYLLAGTALFSDLVFNVQQVMAKEGDPPPSDTKKSKDGTPEASTQTAATQKPPQKTQKEKDAEISEQIRKELNELEVKRVRLQKEQEKIDQERKDLNALKQEVEAKIEQWSQINKSLDKKLTAEEKKKAAEAEKKKAAEEAQLKKLVKVYSNMKPKKAAAVIENLDLEVTVKLFLRLKGSQAGKILSFVNPDRAAQISERLTQIKKTKP